MARLRRFLVSRVLPRDLMDTVLVAMTAYFVFIAVLQVTDPRGVVGYGFRLAFGQACEWETAQCTLALLDQVTLSIPITGVGAMLLLGAMLAGLLEFMKHGGYKLPYYIQVVAWLAIVADAARHGAAANAFTVVGFFIYIAPVAFALTSTKWLERRWARQHAGTAGRKESDS